MNDKGFETCTRNLDFNFSIYLETDSASEYGRNMSKVLPASLNTTQPFKKYRVF